MRPARPLPSLSLVIPNYNHGHCLARALEAVLAQPLVPNEIIVVDDASTDHSIDVVESFARGERSIKLIRNESNLGCMASNNRGYEAASGHYLNSLGADDLPCQGLYLKSLELLRDNPSMGFCCSDIFLGYDGNSVLKRADCRWLDAAGAIAGKEWAWVMPLGTLHTHTVVVRRDLFFHYGGLDSELDYMADWFAYTNIGFRHGLCYIPEPLAIWSIDNRSWSNAKAHEEQKHLNYYGLLSQRLNEARFQDVAGLYAASGALRSFFSAFLGVLGQTAGEQISTVRENLLSSSFHARWHRAEYPELLHMDLHVRRAREHMAAGRHETAAEELCQAMSCKLEARHLHMLLEALDGDADE